MGTCPLSLALPPPPPPHLLASPSELPAAYPEERQYGGGGVSVAAGDELAAFALGSTVVLVFQAPAAGAAAGGEGAFTVARGDRVRVGQALWAPGGGAGIGAGTALGRTHLNA